MTLSERMAGRILDLEAERDRLDATIEVLRDLLHAEEAEAEAAEAEQEVPEENPRSRRGKPRAKRASPGVAVAQHALRIARLIADGGPLTTTEIKDELNLSNQTVSDATKYQTNGRSWFSKADRQSPWELTLEGKEQLENPSD